MSRTNAEHQRRYRARRHFEELRPRLVRLDMTPYYDPDARQYVLLDSDGNSFTVLEQVGVVRGGW